MNSDRRLTLCLTVGLDALSLWIGSFKSTNPSMISRGELDIAGGRRVLALLERHDIRSTFLIPGHTALAYPRLVKEIVAGGHEIAYHGWVHEDPRDFDIAGQRTIIERGLEALDLVAGVRPRGHVAPAWNLSEHSMALAEEFGFEYDGSRMATDCYPVYVRKDDRWSTSEPYRFGPLTDIVGLPVAWPLDDVPLFEFVWGEMDGLASPAAVERIWKDEFDYAYANCPGGVFNLTVHGQVTGRGHRMLLLERFIAHVKQHDDVTICRQIDYVDWWKPRNPREEWRAQNPELAGDGAITQMPSGRAAVS